MKTTFTAKIIFESNRKHPSGLAEWNLRDIYNVIRDNNFDIEVIEDYLTVDYRPVIIIKENK